MSLIGSILGTMGGALAYLENAQYDGGSIAPADATGGMKVDADGNIYGLNGAVYTLDYAWLLSGASSAYECRMTTVSGTLTTGTTGSWLTCGSDQGWTLVRTALGTSTYVGTLEIRNVSGGVVSATVTITATKEV